MCGPSLPPRLPLFQAFVVLPPDFLHFSEILDFAFLYRKENGKNKFFLSCKLELPLVCLLPSLTLALALRECSPSPDSRGSHRVGGQALAAAGSCDGEAAITHGPINSAQPTRLWASRVLGLGPHQGNRANSQLNSTASWRKHDLITGSPKV